MYSFGKCNTLKYLYSNSNINNNNNDDNNNNRNNPFVNNRRI